MTQTPATSTRLAWRIRTWSLRLPRQNLIWRGLFDGHKLFLAPGERPELPQHLMDESQVGKRIEVFGGLAPDAGVLIPLTVKVK